MAHHASNLRALVFGIAAALPLAAAEAQQSFPTLSEGVLQVCLYTTGAPVSSLENGFWSGWDVDFLSDFAETHGLRFEPVAIEVFVGIWEKPGEGVCDVSGGGITFTDQRVESTPDAVWSDPYFRAKRSVVVREGEQDQLTGVDDLAGRTVLVWPGSSGELDVTRRIIAGGVSDVTIEPPGSAIAALRKVRNEEVFGFEGDLTFQLSLVARYPGLAVTWIRSLMAEDGTEADETYSYVTRRADTGLIEALDAFIAENGDGYGWPR